MKPYGFFIGEVTRVADLTTKTGKRCIAINLQGTEIVYGEKSFRPKVEVKCYQNQDQMVALKAGTWVMARGEMEARTYEYNQKSIPIITMTGQVEPMDLGPVDTRPAPPTKPPPTVRYPTAASTPSLPLGKTAPPPPAEDEGEDDVPF
jgi:hypothetical protein